MDIKKVAQEIFSALENGNWDKIRSHTTPDFTFSGRTPQPMNREQWLAMQNNFLKAFPDLAYNLKNIDVRGDMAHAAIRITGTHKGPLDLTNFGLPVVPATGKNIKLPDEHADLTFKDDKIARIHITGAEDPIKGLLQQLDVKMPQAMPSQS